MKPLRARLVTLFASFIVVLVVCLVSQAIENVVAVTVVKSMVEVRRSGGDPWAGGSLGDNHTVWVEEKVIAGAPSLWFNDPLWIGVIALRSGDPERGARHLELAVDSRGDPFASYSFARALESCSRQVEAVSVYVQHPYAHDSAQRVIELVDRLLDPHGSRHQHAEMLLRSVLQVDSENIWAQVLLAYWGYESPEVAVAAINRIRFRQILPRSLPELARACEALSIGLEAGYVDRDLAGQIWGVLSVHSGQDWVEAPDTLAPKPVAEEIQYSAVRRGTAAEEMEECNGWSIIDRSEVTEQPRRRYQDAEFQAIPVYAQNGMACWLQGLWAEPPNEYLPPSILAQRSISVPKAGAYRLTLRYDTLLEPEGFRLSAHVAVHEGSDFAGFLIPTRTLPLSSGSPRTCVAYLTLDPERPVRLGVRLWSPGVAVILDVVVDDAGAWLPLQQDRFFCE